MEMTETAALLSYQACHQDWLESCPSTIEDSGVGTSTVQRETNSPFKSWGNIAAFKLFGRSPLRTNEVSNAWASV